MRLKDHAERIAAIAKEYARSPENTLVVSPDNRSRAEINQAIHAELQERGVVGKEEHRVEALVPRQDLTGADRTWAARYEFNDVAALRARIERDRHRAKANTPESRASMLPTICSPSCGPMARSRPTIHAASRASLSTAKKQRAFSVGDRIQFTAPANELKVANRELGTVEASARMGG